MMMRQKDGMGRMGAEYEEKPCFTPPEGLDLKGDKGEALVRWSMKDGKVWIDSFDGISLGDPESDQEDASEPDTADASDTTDSADPSAEGMS
jgi:hypothetical protein